MITRDSATEAEQGQAYPLRMETRKSKIFNTPILENERCKFWIVRKNSALGLRQRLGLVIWANLPSAQRLSIPKNTLIMSGTRCRKLVNRIESRFCHTGGRWRLKDLIIDLRKTLAGKSSTMTDSTKSWSTVAIIPSLETCFLRKILQKRYQMTWRAEKHQSRAIASWRPRKALPCLDPRFVQTCFRPSKRNFNP